MSDDARRGIDAVLDPGFTSEASDLSNEDLRARLARAIEVEEELSYVRRLLHGKLDILRADLERRDSSDATTADDPESGSDMVARLATILGGSGDRTSRGARARIPSPSVRTSGRRRAELVVSEATLARLPDLSPDDANAAVERLIGAERDVSSERRKVFDVIDTLRSELTQRYKAGLAPPI